MNISELGVLVETYTGHRRFLKPCLLSVRELRAPHIVCSYCHDLDSSKRLSITDVFPHYDVLQLADSAVLADFGQRVNGWLWLQKSGLALIERGGKDIPRPKYVFAIEGDCIITRPKGIHELQNVLDAEGTDLICSEYIPGQAAGAVSYLAKLDAIIPIIDLMIKDAYVSHAPDGSAYGNIEGRFAKAIQQLGFKCSKVNNPVHSQFSYGYRGTWGDCLGFKHLHGMEKWRQSVHHKPLPREWYDTRYLSHGELEILQKFWDTGSTDHFIEKGYWSPVSEERIAMGIQFREEK